MSTGVSARVSVGMSTIVSIPRQAREGGGGWGLLFTGLTLGTWLADTKLGPQAHSSILALWDAVG